jgi:flagellar assembly protein FliH
MGRDVAQVIRSVALDAAPHRLAHRLAPVPAVKSAPAAAIPIAAATPVAAPPAIDPALQQAWQQRMQAELDAACAKAEAEGRAAGHATGLAQALAQTQQQREATASLLAVLGQAVDAQIDGLEDAAIAIAFEATIQLLGERLATKDGVRAAVQRVLERVRTNDKATVRLSPADHQLLTQAAEQDAGIDTSRFGLVSDATVRLGGCVVETRAGRIEGSLETQLARLIDSLVSARRAVVLDAGAH